MDRLNHPVDLRRRDPDCFGETFGRNLVSDSLRYAARVASHQVIALARFCEALEQSYDGFFVTVPLDPSSAATWSSAITMRSSDKSGADMGWTTKSSMASAVPPALRARLRFENPTSRMCERCRLRIGTTRSLRPRLVTALIRGPLCA